MNRDQFAKQHLCIFGKTVKSNIRVCENKDYLRLVKINQFPIMLLWRCTSHKVRCLRLDEAVVSCDLFKQENFNYGQL